MDHFGTASNDATVNQVARMAKPTQASPKIVAGNARAGIRREQAEPLLDLVDEAIGFHETVARDVIPDLVDVGLGERRDDYLGHAPARWRRSRPRRLVSSASNGRPSPAIQLLDRGIEQGKQRLRDPQGTAAARPR